MKSGMQFVQVTLIAGLLAAVCPAASQTWMPAYLSPSNNWLSAASSADGSKIIAVAESGIYAISTNSGTTWITNTEPQHGSPNYGSWGLIASSADGTKFCGIAGGATWVSTNAGTTWLSNNVPGTVFLSVCDSADGSKLAAADQADNGLSGLIYTFTNYGITWAPTAAPSNLW